MSKVDIAGQTESGLCLASLLWIWMNYDIIFERINSTKHRYQSESRFAMMLWQVNTDNLTAPQNIETEISLLQHVCHGTPTYTFPTDTLQGLSTIVLLVASKTHRSRSLENCLLSNSNRGSSTMGHWGTYTSFNQPLEAWCIVHKSLATYNFYSSFSSTNPALSTQHRLHITW